MVLTRHLFVQQDKMDGFVPAHFLGWYIKVGLELAMKTDTTPTDWTLLLTSD